MHLQPFTVSSNNYFLNSLTASLQLFLFFLRLRVAGTEICTLLLKPLERNAWLRWQKTTVVVQELGLTPLLYPGLEEPPCPGQFIALMMCFATFEKSFSALLESLATYKLPWVTCPSHGEFGSLANGFYLSKKKFDVKIQRKLHE